MTKYTDFESQETGSRPNKSALKRDMQELKTLAKQLVEVPQHVLDKIEMEELLFNAMVLARRLPNDKSIRRQLLYITKLLNQTDTTQIKHVLDTYSLHQQNANKAFHDLEKWVDRLTNSHDNTALNDLLIEHQHLDRQHLAQLIRNSQKEEVQKKPPASKRKIFKYLRENIESGSL